MYHPCMEKMFQLVDTFCEIISATVNFKENNVIPTEGPMGYTGALRMVLCRNLILYTQKWAAPYVITPRYLDISVLDMPSVLWQIVAAFRPTTRLTQHGHPDVVAEPSYIEDECKHYLAANGIKYEAIFDSKRVTIVNATLRISMKNALRENLFTTEIPATSPSLLTAGPVITGTTSDSKAMTVCSVNPLDLLSEQLAVSLSLTPWKEQKYEDDICYLMKVTRMQNTIVRTTATQSVTTRPHYLNHWIDNVTNFLTAHL
jgi:hypothetical protein